MTPAARTQAAIELLDAIIAAARDGGAAADTLIARYFAARRYAGSKDRRAVRELVYAAIRACGERPASGRGAMLALGDAGVAATFDGSPHGPAPVVSGEPVATTGTASAWLADRLRASDIDSAVQAALVGRAPLDVRVNSLRPATLAIAAAEPVGGVEGALRLPAGTPVETLPEWRAGAVEVQDAGSQLVAAAVGAQPGEAVVDLCAGAGGKTLALAAAMANTGTLLACDSDRARLSRLPPRAERAGVTIVERRLLGPGREAEALADWTRRADRVLIDAPCSGTGTWRRNPEARWRLTPGRLDALTGLQARLLALGATLVRSGGTLTWVVCSLLDAEGPDQIAGFLAAHPDWTAAPLAFGTARGSGTRLDPLRHDTDGFFVAQLVAP